MSQRGANTQMHNDWHHPNQQNTNANNFQQFPNSNPRPLHPPRFQTPQTPNFSRPPPLPGNNFQPRTNQNFALPPQRHLVEMPPRFQAENHISNNINMNYPPPHQLSQQDSGGQQYLQRAPPQSFAPPQFPPQHATRPPPFNQPLNPPPPFSAQPFGFQQQPPPVRGPPLAPAPSNSAMPPTFMRPTTFMRPPPPVIQRQMAPHRVVSAPMNDSMPLNTITPLAEPLSKVAKGAQLLNQWLQKAEHLKKGKSQDKVPTSTKEKDPVKLLKHVQNLAAIKRELSLMSENISRMEQVVSEADSSVWERQATTVENKKEKLKALLSSLNANCKYELYVRGQRNKKKRDRLQRARKLKYDMKQTRKDELDTKGAEIDKWQQAIVNKMRDKDMKEKRKATADSTLSKVTKEIQDANRLVETMKALEKLRLIRRDAAEKRGDVELGESRASFEQKITDMTRLVRGQLEHYRAEETRLKVIIKSEVEENDRQIAENQRIAEQLKQNAEDAEIETILFGTEDIVEETDPMYPYDQYYKQAHHSLPSFLQIRQSWDAFLVPPQLAGGSGIPDSWVTPDEPGSLAWAKLLV